jgi:hypothetical protein
LFIKLIRAINTEWRHNITPSVINELGIVFLQELVHGNAKDITEKYIQSQQGRKEFFKKLPGYKHNKKTTFSFKSDCKYHSSKLKIALNSPRTLFMGRHVTPQQRHMKMPATPFSQVR